MDSSYQMKLNVYYLIFISDQSELDQFNQTNFIISNIKPQTPYLDLIELTHWWFAAIICAAPHVMIIIAITACSRHDKRKSRM